MDSSNRLSIILGNSQVPLEAITKDDWARVALEIMFQCEPCFKYVGSKPLQEFLNSETSPGVKLSTSTDVVSCPAGVTLRSRCIWLHKTRTPHDGGKDGDIVKYRGLLLLEDRTFLLWKGKYRKEWLKHPSRDVAISCVLTNVTTSPEFANYFEHGIIGYNMLDSISMRFYELVAEKERHLGRLKQIRDLTLGMRGRIAI